MPSFFKTRPRTCALVLAATEGSRLFPMTSPDETPKHLLPVAGIPCIIRLLDSLSVFPQVVIAVSFQDARTLEVLQTLGTLQKQDESKQVSGISTIDVKGSNQIITVVKLGEDCLGTVQAVQQVEEKSIIDPTSRLIVFPGDLVVLKKDLNFDDLMRPTSDDACLAMLTDCGELDEQGLPMKESAKVCMLGCCRREKKAVVISLNTDVCVLCVFLSIFFVIIVIFQAKRGGLAREEEDIEYICLSYMFANGINGPVESELPRIVWKQPKLDVEADEDMTGSTAKLKIPKARLRGGKVVVRTEWSDVHVYSLAPWVRDLIKRRNGITSIQDDVLPLLISRQFRGKKATYGGNYRTDDDDDDDDDAGEEKFVPDNEPYSILGMALPNKTVLRANTIAAYLYACREVVANGASLTMPEGSKWNGKFQSLVLEGTEMGTKINMKASVVGKNCQLGSKCRLNNVIIMDDVVIGDNCSLQNTIIGHGAKLGNNCSLNDCQVGKGKEIPAGTKEKGESFMVGDIMVEDML